MIPNRYDYSILLSNLKEISKNYCYDEEKGIVWSKKAKQEETDENIVTSVLFGSQYCLAYINLLLNSNNVYDNDPLNNTNIFNYFINVCLNEYKIYGDIGSGNVTYAPYQELADYLFANEERKDVVLKYLISHKNIIARIGHNIFDEDKVKSL